MTTYPTAKGDITITGRHTPGTAARFDIEFTNTGSVVPGVRRDLDWAEALRLLNHFGFTSPQVTDMLNAAIGRTVT